MKECDAIIRQLNLSPHPEGGHYRQTWIASAGGGQRPAGTCIYYLLKAGEHSHWHRIDAVEIWHFYAGAPLTLRIAADESGPADEFTLGPDVLTGEVPQVIVPKYHWQSARSTGVYSLVGCTVSPGFQFDRFEMAAKGFRAD